MHMDGSSASLQARDKEICRKSTFFQKTERIVSVAFPKIEQGINMEKTAEIFYIDQNKKMFFVAMEVE